MPCIQRQNSPGMWLDNLIHWHKQTSDSHQTWTNVGHYMQFYAIMTIIMTIMINDRLVMQVTELKLAPDRESWPIDIRLATQDPGPSAACHNGSKRIPVYLWSNDQTRINSMILVFVNGPGGLITLPFRLLQIEHVTLLWASKGCLWNIFCSPWRHVYRSPLLRSCRVCLGVVNRRLLGVPLQLATSPILC